MHIPLQEVKPVFIRSIFQEEESFNDVVQLAKALDEYLLDYSVDAASRGIIFVDVNQYQNAYSVKGRYTLENGQVLLKGRLFKGNMLIGTFSVSGTEEKLQELVNLIFIEVNKVLDH